jgi:hypothetical protein
VERKEAEREMQEETRRIAIFEARIEHSTNPMKTVGNTLRRLVIYSRAPKFAELSSVQICCC